MSAPAVKSTPLHIVLGARDRTRARLEFFKRVQDRMTSPDRHAEDVAIYRYLLQLIDADLERRAAE